MSDSVTKVTLGRPGSVRLATDPVCGMKVDPSRPAATLTRNGQTFYFCHPGCKERFEMGKA